MTCMEASDEYCSSHVETIRKSDDLFLLLTCRTEAFGEGNPSIDCLCSFSDLETETFRLRSEAPVSIVPECSSGSE